MNVGALEVAFRAANEKLRRTFDERSDDDLHPPESVRRTGRRPAVPRLEREPHEHAATTLPPPIGRADPPPEVGRCQPG